MKRIRIDYDAALARAVAAIAMTASALGSVYIITIIITEVFK